MRPQTIVERLDFVAKRIPGLKLLQLSQVDEHSCIMGCDMYFIEIKFDNMLQSVKDVIITHEANADTSHCAVLRKVLADQDYETFAKHLSGLHSIYQINSGDKKVRQKAYPTLTALETDLTILYDHQRRRTNNCHDLVHKSPIGIMEPRKGGFPVKLTYFITPYDLVDTNQKGLINLTIDNVIDRNLGLSVTVEIEGSSAHKLQVKSLISSQHNSSLPAYAPFNTQNSEKLPAQFVLKLSQPFPMLNTSINQIISEINEPTTIKEYLTTIATNSKESLISLIARQELDLNKGPFLGRGVELKVTNGDVTCDLKKHVYTVRLLEQYHTYHILDHHLERQDGVYVTKIPFTHPTSIPIILRILRQQALFNFVIGSCIRRSKNNNNGVNCKGSMLDDSAKFPNDSSIFDVIPVNLNSICVSFEHPSKDSLATLEIDFKDLSCQLYALDKESVCSNEFATKVLQKCWSIPITLRSVLKKCDERRIALLEDANKRRERELQELLTNNTSNQQVNQFKPHPTLQDTVLQSKFNNMNEKSNQRDLNSIAEFLTSRINQAGTSDASNQTNSNNDSASTRTNLLKKFSCKPKTKLSPAVKNQTGSKILSLMLKRQNSTSASSEDVNLKATLVKKVKTKNAHNDTGTKAFTPGVSTTKLISTETAARLANKQSKQNTATGQNVSLSLIRSPSKSQNLTISSSSATSSSSSSSSLMTTTATTSIPVGVNLNPHGIASTSKQLDSSLLCSTNANQISVRVKPSNTGPNSNTSTTSKSRKSSIGAVLDKLVGGVTPEQNSLNLSNQESHSETAGKNPDSFRTIQLGSKSKSRIPIDQFAIKQGSLGGLKLTVTKTKSTIASSTSVASVATGSTGAPSSNSASASQATTSLSNSITKSETNKILGLGSTTPCIKYTIPKISKTQQASQSSSSQANSTDNQNSTESNSQSDDSSNPSSTANSSAPSSSTNKRVQAPFGRPNNSNRNSVSSSTHPLARTTSNPLAGASRPSSTSTNESHNVNRISSSIQGQQSMRQQATNRTLNPQQPPQQLQANVPRMLNSGIISGNQPGQLVQNPLFNLQGLAQPDIHILAANQAALLNHRNPNMNAMQQISGPFMSSSVDANLISSSKPQFAVALPQIISNLTNNMTSNVGDSMQRPSPSVINATPQFYVRQPMFDDNANAVSSTPKATNEPSPSTLAFGIDPNSKQIPATNSASISAVASMATATPSGSTNADFMPIVGDVNTSRMNDHMSSSTGNQTNLSGNQGVSSSSDMSAQEEVGPTISTPSSPVECGVAETVEPPPLIPIDSLEEPQDALPGMDHSDDASDRLSIVDTNENIADSNSVAGTPKPSSISSPYNAHDSNPAIASSSSRSVSLSGGSANAPPSSATNNGDPVATNSESVPGSSQNMSNANGSERNTSASTNITNESLNLLPSPPVSTATLSKGPSPAAAPPSSSTSGEESNGPTRQPGQSVGALSSSDETLPSQTGVTATMGEMI